MCVDERSSVTMVIMVMYMKQLGGSQRLEHCSHRDQTAESAHRQTFSWAPKEQVNGKRLSLHKVKSERVHPAKLADRK